MAPVTVRYIVDDVDAAIAFYTQRLGFGVELRPAPGFAIVSRGDLRLLLNAPIGPGGAAQPMPDGRKPEPGGWNRIQLQVDDLASEVAALRKAGATSEMTLSPAWAESRSCSTTRRAIPSNCSNPLVGDVPATWLVEQTV